MGGAPHHEIEGQEGLIGWRIVQEIIMFDFNVYIIFEINIISEIIDIAISWGVIDLMFTPAGL